MKKIDYLLLLVFGTTLFALTTSNYVNKSHPNPSRVRFYPKKSVFKKSDLIDRGCNVFIRLCPKIYKQNVICARHYDGKFKTFNNYCEMEFENCNGWRQWSMIKLSSCY